MVAGSHHSPERFIIYIQIEKTLKKILAISEGHTPTVAEKLFIRTIDVTAQPNQISIYSHLFINK